jgi:hypothetical protein
MQKQNHKNYKQEYEMCKTNVKTDLYYVNIKCKHEHEKNMTRLWCKIMPKTNVEQIEKNQGSYLYLYLFWGPSSRKLLRRILCVHRVKKLFENLSN